MKIDIPKTVPTNNKFRYQLFLSFESFMQENYLTPSLV